jgi:hypothetical protein
MESNMNYTTKLTAIKEEIDKFVANGGKIIRLQTLPTKEHPMSSCPIGAIFINQFGIDTVFNDYENIDMYELAYEKYGLDEIFYHTFDDQTKNLTKSSIRESNYNGGYEQIRLAIEIANYCIDKGYMYIDESIANPLQ